MDKASDFESKDCEFESRHGLLLFRLIINVTSTRNKIHGCLSNKKQCCTNVDCQAINCKRLLTNWHSDIVA